MLSDPTDCAEIDHPRDRLVRFEFPTELEHAAAAIGINLVRRLSFANRRRAAAVIVLIREARVEFVDLIGLIDETDSRDKRPIVDAVENIMMSVRQIRRHRTLMSMQILTVDVHGVLTIDRKQLADVDVTDKDRRRCTVRSISVMRSIFIKII